jgi:signal transduction histidine kinase
MLKWYKVPPLKNLGNLPEAFQQYETRLEYQRNVLEHIIDVGTSLRLSMDTDTLLKRVCVAACDALRFRVAALYLSDGAGYFRARAVWGDDAEKEAYLYQHPLPEAIVARLICDEYRLSDSYFIPAEAPIWQEDPIINSLFVVNESLATFSSSDHQTSAHSAFWQPEDLMLVPLVRSDNLTLLGFLTPDGPEDGLRPTAEATALFELFANQAAVAIEGAQLYEEVRQSSEERAALVEIGRALSAPDALHDLQSVYRAIHEQVKRMMPAEAFLIIRYFRADEKVVTDYLIDEGIEYPATDYGAIRPQTRQLLLHSFLFSTPQEYAAFAGYEPPADESDVLGGGRVSESLLFVPIRYGEEVIGILSVQSYQPYAYTQRHREILTEIGVQAGIAITNARLNTELREALEQAQVSERLKDHFLMTASHELRTPLTAIQGYLELLGDFGSAIDEEAKTRFIGNARRACEELVLLLGNVMDASRIDQDRVTLTFSQVCVAQAVQVILEILEPIIVREQRHVDSSIAGDLCVWVDELRLRQILLNLVGNALKYTPESSNIAISGEIVSWDELYRRTSTINQQIPVPVSGEFIVIAIRDWGSGITLEDQPRLFSKFVRLTEAINSMQRGAGLGLYLCRQLTEAMQGHIWMESKGVDGEGAMFFVALPRC